MAVEIRGTYAGNLKTRLVHGPSGAEIFTAAPVDNQGDGSSFSPTDLVAGALGACMMTILGIMAERNGISMEGVEMRVVKHMTSDPRRIAELEVVLYMPPNLAPDDRLKLERGALTCPVHRSLLAEIGKPVRFVYDGEEL
ncbi:MAG: OsmC family protein [Acidobacteria bacterium]|nr:OsmC family protein [Acidobacteriota bacterium]